MNEMQRTREWRLARRGKITASECHLLLARPRVKGETFTKSALTYLEERVAEMYTPVAQFVEECEAQPESRPLVWGTAHEDEARERFAEEYGVDVEDAPFIPLGGYERFAGGSPDGLCPGADNSIIEIKCPYTKAAHIRHFLYRDASDLRDDNPQYYAQCQMNMLAVERSTGAECPRCAFISYHPRLSRDMQLSALSVPKDEEYQGELLERLALAVEYIRERVAAIDRKRGHTKGCEA